MDIGLTYDLRSAYLADGYTEDETAEFDRDDTIVAIETALARLGHTPERIGNGWQLVRRLADGDRWPLVFNIAEGLYGIGREAQVPAILDLYAIAYTFSDPLVCALTLHKGMTKRVLRDADVPTADFSLVADAGDMEQIRFEPPYFIKPNAEGTGKGVTTDSIVRSRQALWPACRQLIDTFHQPVLVEPYLTGREFTTGVIGTGADARVLGTLEVHLLASAEPGVYSYLNKEECESRVDYRLVRPEDDPVVEAAEAVALNAWRVLGCRDGGRIDLRCDPQGRPLFLEVNPLAGLHPEHSDLPILCTALGIAYADLIGWIVDSAAKRLPMRSESRPHAYRHCA